MRIISFIMLGIVAVYAPFWLFVLASVVYSFVYVPYEVLLIAVVIDAQFGDASVSFAYRYTLAIAILCMSVTLIKPKLRMYTKLHDVQDF